MWSFVFETAVGCLGGAILFFFTKEVAAHLRSNPLRAAFAALVAVVGLGAFMGTWLGSLAMRLIEWVLSVLLDNIFLVVIIILLAALAAAYYFINHLRDERRFRDG